MSSALATQCPHCATVFQMHLEQLREHGHQVRCGRCFAVFNAIQNLTDFAVEPIAQEADTATTVSEPEEDPRQLDLPMMREETLEIPFFTPKEATQPRAPSPPISTFRPSEPLPEYEDRNDLFAQEQAEYRSAKIAEQHYFARVKRYFAITFFALSIVLFGGQVLYTFSNSVVTQLPQTRPAVDAFCRLWGCHIGPPRVLSALGISESVLGQAPLRIGQLYLEVVLKNSADQAIAWPSLELTLKDRNNQVVARKIFKDSEFLAPELIEAGFSARSVRRVRVNFAVNEIESTGYSVSVFYP